MWPLGDLHRVSEVVVWWKEVLWNPWRAYKNNRFAAINNTAGVKSHGRSSLVALAVVVGLPAGSPTCPRRLSYLLPSTTCGTHLLSRLYCFYYNPSTAYYFSCTHYSSVLQCTLRAKQSANQSAVQCAIKQCTFPQSTRSLPFVTVFSLCSNNCCSTFVAETLRSWTEKPTINGVGSPSYGNRRQVRPLFVFDSIRCFGCLPVLPTVHFFLERLCFLNETLLQ